MDGVESLVKFLVFRVAEINEFPLQSLGGSLDKEIWGLPPGRGFIISKAILNLIGDRKLSGFLPV